MSLFELWIRTGRWVPAQLEDPELEVKSNPYHDPDTGRFTSADGSSGVDGDRPDAGSDVPKSPTWGDKGFSGGGGGSGGGAGASGDWGLPGQTASETGEDSIVRVDAAIARERAGDDPSSRTAVTVTKNGYDFQVDTLNRTTNVDGGLSLENAARSRANQKQAGGTDRLPSDDGGHFIAARFNGPNNSFNSFAQDAIFNRGAYRALEDSWAKNVKEGKSVFVDISAHYPGTSTRPDSLAVNWTVDGQTRRREFGNSKKGR